MLEAKLVVVGGDAKAKEVHLKLPTVIGRGREATLLLPHPLVSRQHTRIFEQDGTLYVRDLGSLNGTYVNNQRTQGDQKLAPNQLLTLGNVTFRAIYEVAGKESVPEAREDVQCIGMASETPADLNETINTNQARPKMELAEFEPAQSQPVAAAADRLTEKPADRLVGEPAVLVESPENNSQECPLEHRDPDVDVNAIGKDQLAAQSPPNDVLAEAIEKAGESAGGTDKDCPDLASAAAAVSTSSIFTGEEAFLSPERSISIDAIEDLPNAPSPPSSIEVMMDFVGGGSQNHVESAIHLEIEGSESPAAVSSDSLGSFLKKLPR